MLLWHLVLQYGAAAIVLVFYVTISLHFNHTPDETYVYMRYGQNIARGEGFSFNAGTTSYGITGPLWALLIAGGVKLNLDPYIVAKTLDVVLASLALMAVLAVAYVIIRDRLYALVAALIFSFDAWFLRWSASGTETSLGVLLAMVSLWYAYKKEYITASLVIGLLTLVRPEGVILFIASQIDALLNAHAKRGTAKIVVASVILYVLVVGTWMGFSLIHFGRAFPNLFPESILTGITVSAMLTSAFTSMKILGATQLVLVLFLFGGALLTVWKFGWHILREEGFPLLWALAVPFFYMLFAVDVGSRHMLLVLPVFIIYGCWGIKRLETGLVVSPQRGFLILLVVAGISLGQNQVIYRLWILPHMNNLELGVNECLKPVAYWLRTNTPAGTKVLTPEAGVIGYASEREVYDATGILTPEARSAFGSDGYDQGMMKRKYEAVVHPEYVVDRSSTPDRLKSETMRPVMTRAFPGSGIRNPELMFYTLYKVIR